MTFDRQKYLGKFASSIEIYEDSDRSDEVKYGEGFSQDEKMLKCSITILFLIRYFAPNPFKIYCSFLTKYTTFEEKRTI
jgi:hypothetical protein